MPGVASFIYKVSLFTEAGMKSARLLCSILVAIAVNSTTLAAQDVAYFEKRITVKQLKNGLTVLVMERPEAPVFSFHIMVDAGAVQHPKGGSGLAHLLEHMTFRRTPVT